jgi:hypothetical protein
MMRKRGMDDRGQAYTMEGVVAGLILVLTLMYITGSITFVSPQTDKSLVMKLGIKAEDILTVLAAEDQPGNFSNELSRGISAWDGSPAAWDTAQMCYTHSATMDPLNQSIWGMLHDSAQHWNLMYNLYLVYFNTTTSLYETMPLVLSGEPYDNTASAMKITVLNSKDIKAGSKWDVADMPRAIEVKIIVWTV